MDPKGELLATLAAHSARLIDEVCSPDSAAPGYARAACIRAHSSVLAQLLAQHSVTPANPWDDIEKALVDSYWTTPQVGRPSYSAAVTGGWAGYRPVTYEPAPPGPTTS
jgi:hypothetical protein